MWRTLSWIFLFSWIAIGCDDMELIDTSAPAIDVAIPGHGGNIIAGEYAQFEAKFTDDVELATYNIEIHDNFGGHSHGRLAKAASDPSLIKWAFKQSFLIPEGLTLYQAVLKDEIEVPSNALAGPYHFIVQAIDQAGNATGFQDDSAVELEVYITNNSQPIINITNLVDGELEMEVGLMFVVEGDITDPTTGEYAGIHGMDVVLGEGLHDDHDHDHGGRIANELLIDINFEGQELEQFIVDDAIILNKVFEDINFILSEEQMEELAAEGIDHLLLTLSVFDEQGNIAFSNIDVHLL